MIVEIASEEAMIVVTDVTWLRTLLYKYFHGDCYDMLFSLVPRLHEFKRATIKLVQK